MGCASSKAADDLPRDRPSSASGPSAVERAPASTVSTKSSAAKTSLVSARAAYETELAASLVESAGTAVAYHGLLVKDGRLNLARVPDDGDAKIFLKSVHPHDDAHLPTPPFELPAAGPSTVTGVAMTMPYTIIVAKSAAQHAIQTIAERVFDAANLVFNGWNPASEVATLNTMPPGKPTPVSYDLLDLFSVVDKVYDLTDGRFDPTTGVLSVAFENCIKERARPPLPSEITPFKYAIGWRKRLQRTANKVARTNANTVVDLDGISKGYIIDLVVDALVSEGFRDCYVDWAGDVRAEGKHPSGRPWRSAVMFPPELRRVFGHWKDGTLKEMLHEDDIAFYATFSFLSEGPGGAIATSGDYFSIQKYGYHHIASAQDMTVLKANQKSVASVCVASTKCAIADAIATAAMTFGQVDHALAFLKGIQSTDPQLVSGFCVMGRKQSPLDLVDSYSPTIFARVLDADSSTTETPAVDSRHDSGVNDEVMDHIQESIIQYSTILHFDGQTFDTDSFVPCSVEPEQLVTFVAPTSFTDRASLVEENELNKLHCFVLRPRPTDAGEQDQGIRLDLRFRRISEFEHCNLVIAVIEKIDLGTTNRIEVMYNDSVLAWRKMDLHVSRSLFSHSPLVEQAKDVFRQTPSMVWIAATKTADQLELGMTATSVTVPQVAESVVCFNVMHTSAFYAGFGGPGSRIRTHALSTRQKDLARKYTDTSRLDLDAISRLESESMVTADCTVESVESVQDHIIVLARVNEVRYIGTKLVPLVWLHGNYVNK